MKIKIQLEVEVFTKWHEVEGCTPDNFADHVKFILTSELGSADIIDSDIQYRSSLINYEVNQ